MSMGRHVNVCNLCLYNDICPLVALGPAGVIGCPACATESGQHRRDSVAVQWRRPSADRSAGDLECNIADRRDWCTHTHWSPTVPVSVWLPEPARDRGSKQKTLNDDCYHTTRRSAAIFGVKTVLPHLVLTLDLWIGLCPVKRSSGVWSFSDVSVTYRSRRAMFR